MMTEKQFKLTVQDNTNIEVKVNFTDVDSKGIIHIFHGMAEHMERYDKLAHALSKDGFDVIRHNHRGHGINIDESTRGHYDDMKRVIGDAFEVAQTVRGNVDKPYIIIGHSMGSVIARLFVETYPQYVDGLILSGTGMYPLWIHRKLVTTVFIGFGVPNGSLNYILSKILVVFLSSSLNFSSNK